MNEAQLSVQIGQKNVTDKKSTSNSLHTASDIISTEGNVNLNAGKMKKSKSINFVHYFK
ncbi:hypothetical protein [Commensalibacter sp. A3DC]|uniref:hypothetical protein n=1 Tax=Commensalibacter sp. A3DC TaxID=3093920 RepID=UPI0039B5026B